MSPKELFNENEMYYGSLAKRFSMPIMRIIENQQLNNKQKILKLEYILEAINRLDNDMNDIDIKRELNKIFVQYEVDLRV